MKTFRDIVNELVVGAGPKKKDKKGNLVYADFVENGVRIKWFMPWGDHTILVHPDTEDFDDPQTYGQFLYRKEDYFDAAAKYDEVLKAARKGKIKYSGKKSYLENKKK